MSIDIPGGTRQDDDAVARAVDVLRAAERRFTRHDPDSEVARLGRGVLPLDAASPDLLEVLTLAEQFRVASGGAFDVARPDGSLDLDGIVKGWAAQRAADVLVDAGIARFCLNAGGDLVVRGGRAPGEPWRVSVRSPFLATESLVVLPIVDGAVATSGTYERGEHVLDPRAGRAATQLVSVTVVADDLLTADVLATTVLAMGERGPGWATERCACGVLAVRPDGSVIETGGARG